jgi:flagellar protein FliS
MTTSSFATTQAYQQIGITSEVEAATPHRLIQLMMERVLTKIAMARSHMERKSIAEKGANITSAIDIICGLQVSLNQKPAPKIAGNFDALYDYMTRRLTEANFRNDPAKLDEVAGLMRELKEAWDAIAPEVDAA